MTATEEIYDASIRHRVALLRLQNAIAEQLVAGPLRSSDRKLIAGLAALLATAQLSAGSIIGAATAPKIGRLAGVERFVNENASALEAAALAAMIPALGAIAVSEASWQVDAISEFRHDAVAPPPPAVAAIPETHPIGGNLLKNMVAGFVLTRAFRVMQRTRRGVTEGETAETIVEALSGTKSRAYRDGVLESGRRSTRGLVHQAVEGTATAAREMVFRRNGRLLQGIRWISVLDSVTSPICWTRSGMIFPVGAGPRPPAHPNCRSTVAPVFKGDNAPPPETYGEWLDRQPHDVQNEVLGPTRGDLFRKGGLTVDKFVDIDSGRQWPLAELKKREAAAFAQAFQKRG